MMNNETKWDVFKDAVETLYVMDGAPDDYRKKLLDRYDAALRGEGGRKMKNVELVMGLSEIKQEYPIGSAYKDEDGMYKVVGYFESLPTVLFASFPGIRVMEVDE